MRYWLLLALAFLCFAAARGNHTIALSVSTTGGDIIFGAKSTENVSFGITNSGPDPVVEVNITIPADIIVIDEIPPVGWNSLSTDAYVSFQPLSSGLSGQAFFNITIQTSFEEDSNVTWYLSTEDNASYVLNSTAACYADATPPTMVLNAIKPLNVTVYDSAGISAVIYRIENGSWVAMSYSAGFYVALMPGLDEGNYSVTVYANDSYNNSDSIESWYIVDMTPPEITITSPEETTYSTRQIALIFAVNDNLSEEVYCMYKRDSELLPMGFVQVGVEYNQEILFKSDGSHVLYMNCTDMYGNYVSTEPIVFSISTEPGYQPPPPVYYPPEREEEVFDLQSSIISIVLEPAKNRTIYIQITNRKSDSMYVHINSTGFVEQFLMYEMNDFEVAGNSFVSIPIVVEIPDGTSRGVYAGEIYLWADGERRGVPLLVEVVEEMRTMIYSAIDLIEDDLFTGDNLQIRVRVFNIGNTRPRYVTINYTVRPQDENTPAFYHSEQRTMDLLAFSFDTNLYPGILTPGNYLLEVSVNTENYTDSSFSTFSVQTQTIMTLEIFGFKLYQILILAFLIVGLMFLFAKSSFFFYGRIKERRISQLKYRQEQVSLPKKSERSIVFGKVAETDNEAYFDMDELTKHVLISGGTGSGKTIAGMVIAEEALLKGCAVVVFDPTLQWTGFFKENTDPGMVAMLKTYGAEPKRFDSEIVSVTSPDQDVDIDLSPGRIVVMALNKLDSHQLDKFVENFINAILQGSWPESSELKYLVIFDEIHRLLQRYGSTRYGIISVEKAVREFRKWGFGVVMISQVLTDFKSAIRTNIGTEIQLRTEFEGDIRRIKAKYGAELAMNIAKLSVGTALVQNPEYNNGKPYLIKFRPPMHEPKAISESEVAQIEAYKKRIKGIEDKIKTMEKQGIDLFNEKSELELAKEKLRLHQYAMLDAHLESVERGLND